MTCPRAHSLIPAPSQVHFFYHLSIYFLKDFHVFIIRGRVREGEREGRKHQCQRETSTACLPYAPWQGTEPVTQLCALTRNRTGDLLPCRTVPNQLSHTGQGSPYLFKELTSSHTPRGRRNKGSPVLPRPFFLRKQHSQSATWFGKTKGRSSEHTTLRISSKWIK